MKIALSVLLAVVGLVLLGLSLYYMSQGDYARATFDLILGIWNMDGARRLASG